MCGIFGIIGNKIPHKDLKVLQTFSERRGRDSSGLFISRGEQYRLYRANYNLSKLLKLVDLTDTRVVMGHSRLVTNGMDDNQPIYRDDVCVVHNGIIVNTDGLWKRTNKTRFKEIDTEIIAAMVSEQIEKGITVLAAAKSVLKKCDGVVACAIAIPKLGKLCLFSNNGNLYYGKKNNVHYFASEKFPLETLKCEAIEQVRAKPKIIEIPKSLRNPISQEFGNPKTNLIPSLGNIRSEEKSLQYRSHNLKRCSRCILPETMPYIIFDDDGVCNYCHNYKTRNQPKPFEELLELVEPFRRKGLDDCIVPFSGGRDSCYGLHLIVKKLGLKPVTYTYDWGMVTDLGRRNISRMCSQLGVENIIIADNVAKKRRNIAMNLTAWLKSPNLGMVSILTAGDKHFFRHVETVKRETGITLNIWGVNPLEVTHFKAGFLGVPPNFSEKRVYNSATIKQLQYQWLRTRAMMHSPSYFNSSLWDTLSGEYYRSFSRKRDYFHMFDYWRWDEKNVDETLIQKYSWETAPDTNTTWRIGDGTAAFYNYIYYTIAGFTEHDTFRSNQIREGDISRQKALELVYDENRPRYPNIKWYLDAIGLNFNEIIPVVNNISKLSPQSWI